MTFVGSRTLVLALSVTACSAPTGASRSPATGAASPPAQRDFERLLPARDFWLQGDAACPEGATLGGMPGYIEVSCEKDGRKHGPWARFDTQEGKLERIGTAVDGENQGAEQTFYASGARHEVRMLVDGRMTGPFTRWHENGTKSLEGAYLDGVPEGLIRAWDDRGREIGTYTITQGSGRIFKWHPNGQKASEVEYVKGQAQGPYTIWNEQGVRTVTGAYVDGERNGDWFTYGSDGRITWLASYAKGLPIVSVPYQAGVPLASPAAPGTCATEAGLAAAYTQQTNRPLPNAKACVERSPFFPSAVLVGTLAPHGCVSWELVLDCQVRGPLDTAVLLERAGWKHANAENRAALARNYVAAFEHSWNPLRAEPTADGGVVVTILPMSSKVLTAGVLPDRSPFPRYVDSYRFSAAGMVTRVEPGPSPGNLPPLPDFAFWTAGNAACPTGAVLERTGTSLQCKLGTKAHGPWAELDKQGQLVQLGTYIDGNLRGAHAHFYPNGQKRMECIKTDAFESLCVRWYENGQRAREGAFGSGGVPAGNVEAWDELGAPLGRVSVVDGTGHVIDWHPNGQKAVEYDLVKGRLEGVRTEWHANGHKRSESTFSAGSPQGTWHYFDEGGQLLRADTYVDGTVSTSLYHHAGKQLAPAPKISACTTHAGLVAAYEKERKKSFAEASACTSRAIHFPGVVAIGERGVGGCQPVGAMIDCRFRPTIDPRAVLARAGWKNAPATIRLALARHYVEEVGAPRASTGEPMVTTDKGDTIVVVTTGWRKAKSVGAPDERVERTFRFHKTGAVTIREQPAL